MTHLKERLKKQRHTHQRVSVYSQIFFVFDVCFEPKLNRFHVRAADKPWLRAMAIECKWNGMRKKLEAVRRVGGRWKVFWSAVERKIDKIFSACPNQTLKGTNSHRKENKPRANSTKNIHRQSYFFRTSPSSHSHSSEKFLRKKVTRRISWIGCSVPVLSF